MTLDCSEARRASSLKEIRPLLSAAGARFGLDLRDRLAFGSSYCSSSNSEDCRDLLVAFRANLDRVAYADDREEFLEILLAHANASRRCRFADRVRLVGAVDSVALRAQSHPARAHRVALAGADDLTLVVVRRVGYAVDDLEFANRTRSRSLADRDTIDANDLSVGEQRQLAVGNADQDPAHRGFGELGSLGTWGGGGRCLQGRADGCHCQHCCQNPDRFFLPIRFAVPQLHRAAP